MNKKFTVTIGIPAYNEEANIKNLLDSVLDQKQNGFIIREIIVISDGSKDNTVLRVREVHDSRIRLIEYKERIGKSQHLNNIFYQVNDDDFLVLLDADVILANPHVIENLIKPLIDNPKVGLVGGNPQPVLASTFIEKAVNASFAPYDKLRTILKNGNNAYGCDGRILALAPMFYKAVFVPRDMIANDAFLYFSCITKGFEFRHVRRAQVWFKSPQNLKDHLKQNKRFIAAHQRLEKYFGEIVPEEYRLPKFLMLNLMLREFLKHPILSIAIFLINKYCAFKAKLEEPFMNAKWKMALTTKKEILK